MAKPKQGPCWKCEKTTRSHVDLLIVATPRGSIRVPIYTCHDCWKGLEENELHEHKIRLRDSIKKAAMVAIQDEKVENVRKQQEESGAEFPSVLGGK